MKYRIKEYRTTRGWTQEQLAQMVGTSKGYVSQMESGKREPSAETLRSLAAAFGVGASQMIEPDDDASRLVAEHVTIFERLSREDQLMLSHLAAKMLRNE